MAAICTMIMTGIPIINFMCFVLCRINCIVIYIATEPPSIDINNRVASGVRCLGRLVAAILS